MKKFNFEYLNNYKNHGQNAEQSIRFHLTGKISKADNVRYDMGTDVLNYQVKSARASVCKGTDLKAYLDMDASSEYIYGAKNGVAYVMNRDEYEEFVREFGTITRESTKNGGGEKIRLREESKAMMAWLENMVYASGEDATEALLTKVIQRYGFEHPATLKFSKWIEMGLSVSILERAIKTLDVLYGDGWE